MRSSEEIYVSVDIETDGPIPGPYSMISIGAAAFSTSGHKLSDFSVNLEPLDHARQHPKTVEFWERNPEAWAATLVDQKHPSVAMAQFERWLHQWPSPVFVGYPAAFDFLFVHWYFIDCLGDDPFGFAALDIKTLAMAAMKTTFRGAVKRNMPKEWKNAQTKHTHVAVEDAIEQGYLFFKILDSLSQV